MTAQLAQVGAPNAEVIWDEDVAELPDLGPAFNEVRVWRHLASLDEPDP